jgi:hypothetical protein
MRASPSTRAKRARVILGRGVRSTANAVGTKARPAWTKSSCTGRPRGFRRPQRGGALDQSRLSRPLSASDCCTVTGRRCREPICLVRSSRPCAARDGDDFAALADRSNVDHLRAPAGLFTPRRSLSSEGSTVTRARTRTKSPIPNLQICRQRGLCRTSPLQLPEKGLLGFWNCRGSSHEAANDERPIGVGITRARARTPARDAARLVQL